MVGALTQVLLDKVLIIWQEWLNPNTSLCSGYLISYLFSRNRKNYDNRNLHLKVSLCLSLHLFKLSLKDSTILTPTLSLGLLNSHILFNILWLLKLHFLLRTFQLTIFFLRRAFSATFSMFEKLCHHSNQLEDILLLCTLCQNRTTSHSTAIIWYQGYAQL